MGGLLIVLGYWAYNGVRDSIAETRVTSLEALLGTVVKGLDVWVGEHTRRSRPRRQGSGGGRARRAPRGGHAAPGCGAGTLHGRGRGPRTDGAVVAVDARAWSRSGSSTARASCWRRRIPRAAGSACAPARSGSGSTSRWTARRNSCARFPRRSFPSRARRASAVRSPGSWRRYAARKRTAGRGAGHGRGGRPRARDDLLRRAAREHGRGVRVLGRRPDAHAVALRARN